MITLNLVDPSRARQLREYISVRSIVMRCVQLATPSYLVGVDGALSGPHYDLEHCRVSGPCGLVVSRFWLRCPFHGREILLLERLCS